MSASPKSLSKSAQGIQDVLFQKGLESNVIELTISARTAKDAASALGCTVAQIVKSLIFKTKETNTPILILASGINRVNEQTLEETLGTKIVKADADYTRDVTGFAIGSIPPIGHKQAISTFIDEDLLQFHELWAAAGTPNAVFRLESKALAELTGGTVISIK